MERVAQTACAIASEMRARYRQRVARDAMATRRVEPDRVPIPRIVDAGRNEVAQVRTGTASRLERPEFRQYWRLLVPTDAVPEQSGIRPFVAERVGRYDGQTCQKLTHNDHHALDAVLRRADDSSRYAGTCGISSTRWPTCSVGR